MSHSLSQCFHRETWCLTKGMDTQETSNISTYGSDYKCHAVGLPLCVQRAGSVRFRKWGAARLKWVVHHVISTSFVRLSVGQLLKHRQVVFKESCVFVSCEHAGSTYGPSKQSPTMLAQILMENRLLMACWSNSIRILFCWQMLIVESLQFYCHGLFAETSWMKSSNLERKHFQTPVCIKCFQFLVCGTWSWSCATYFRDVLCIWMSQAAFSFINHGSHTILLCPWWLFYHCIFIAIIIIIT